MFQVRQLQGDPLALSYWLASNLPLEDDTRQRLLEAPTVVERSVHGLCSAFHCTCGTAVHYPASSKLHTLHHLYCHAALCNSVLRHTVASILQCIHCTFRVAVCHTAPSELRTGASTCVQSSSFDVDMHVAL